MKKAKEKVWLKADRKTLVKDGDPEAAFLLARKGQLVSDTSVANFPGGDTFFEDVNQKAQEPSSHILEPGGDVTPGYTNVGKKESASKATKPTKDNPVVVNKADSKK